MRTLNAAVVAAQTANRSAPGWEIHICTGTLNEALQLNFPISIKGGYQCSDWSRSTSCFDPAQSGSSTPYFASDASANVTKLQAPAGATSYALKINSGISNAVTIDGLTIAGPNNTGEVHAVEVDSSSPTISNCIIQGAGGTSPGSGVLGSVALLLSASSSDIHSNYIYGGSGAVGSSGYAGSLGIFINGNGSGSPHIHDNRIEGGAGTSPAGANTGSAAIFADNPGPISRSTTTAFENNSVYGGTGSKSTGVYLLWSLTKDFDIVGNEIHAGLSGGNGSIALYSNAGGNGSTMSSLIAGNKIYGGDSVTQTAPSTGIELDGAHAMNTVVNNFIHAGNATGTGSATGLVFGSVQYNPTTVAHNMIYAGGSSSSPGYALYLTADSNGGHTVAINNNILAGSGDWTSGLYFAECPAPSMVTSFEGNLFINENLSYATFAPGLSSPCGTSSYSETTVTSLEGQMEPGTVGGNFVYKADCSSETGTGTCVTRTACVPSDPVGCMHDLLIQWDSSTQGESDLWTTTSWNLNPTPSTTPNVPSCSLITSSYNDYQPQFPWKEDIFGNSRPPASAPTVGAVQLSASCH